MIVGLALLTGLLIAAALGANLTRLADLRFRGSVLVFGALAIQAGIFTPLGDHLPGDLDRTLHVVSYLMILGFFALNARVPGFWLVGFGLVSNVCVIFTNGGRMPVSAEAWQASGGDVSVFTPSGYSDNNVLAGPHTHLWWLSDIFAIPPQIPLATVVSIGDLLIVTGMVAFVYRACTPRVDAPSGHVFEPLRSSAFRRVIAGRLVSTLGDWLTQAAVVTWIYSSTRSTAMVSAFLVLRMFGYVVGGVASAPILDRMPGFRTLSMVETVRGLSAIAMIPFASAGQLWPVIGLCTVSSLLASATSPTAQGLIPDVLESGQLQAGNAIHQMSRSLTSVVGAAVGGFVVAAASIQTALVIDLATFLAAALIYRRFAQRGGAVAAPRAPAAERATRRDLARAMLTNRVVLSLAVSFTLATAAIGIMNSASSKAFDDQLGSAHAYGYIVAVVSIGYVASELLTGYMRRQSVARRSVGLSFVATGGAMYLLSHATTAPIAYLALFLFGASDGITEVVRDSLIQVTTPRNVRSGVFAMTNSIQTGGMIVGLALAPVATAMFTTGTVLRIVAVGCVVSGIVAGIGLIGAPRGEGELVASRPAQAPEAADLGMASV
jgi:Na+/melibiose symporter-like transporter